MHVPTFQIEERLQLTHIVVITYRHTPNMSPSDLQNPDEFIRARMTALLCGKQKQGGIAKEQPCHICAIELNSKVNIVRSLSTFPLPYC